MARRRIGTPSTWWLTVLALVGTMAGLFWPLAAAVFSTEDTQPDPVTIRTYRVSLQVDADGRLSAVERIVADFPSGRHGIFRYWDVADPEDRQVRLFPEDIEVLLDDGPVPVELLWEGPRRYRVAKIGDPDAFLSEGSHTYTIRYRIDGALSPSSAGRAFAGGAGTPRSARSAFYWDVVPGGWGMSMNRTRVTVRLPEAPRAVVCVGGREATYPCAARTRGRTMVLATGALPPRTPVTVRATLATPAPDRVTLPWPVSFDAILGRSVSVALALAALSVLALVAGVAWVLSARETEPGFPVMYAPPDGLGPVQTRYVVSEAVPTSGLVATLLYLAERGLVRLDEDTEGVWTVENQADQARWGSLDSVSRALGTSLGLDRPGGSFRADGSVEAGKRLQSAEAALSSRAKAWSRQKGLLARAPREAAGRLLVLLAALLAGIVFVTHPLDVTLLGLPFAAFVVGGAGLLGGGVGTRRTPAGREAWSRAGGFRRLLSTSSAQERFDFSARRELYTAYIPYAVAFDCAEEWARKYETETGERAPVPLWYGTTSSTASFAGSSAFTSFESSLASSIGAYQATQSSSSSGGAGGGGGGGGGGSW